MSVEYLDPFDVKDYRLTGLGHAPYDLEAKVKKEGACVGHPHPEWWLDTQNPNGPVRRMSHGGPNFQYRRCSYGHAAKQVCLSECPVLSECRELVDAIEGPLDGLANVRVGIWAGEPGATRLRRRQKERREAEAA